jgi:serine/threonine-protein kinase
MPDLPLVGTEFAGYRLLSVLGRGGLSIVYQAENPRLHNLIALKVLVPEVGNAEIFRIRFREESKIAAALNHPHVIPIHDFGSSDGLLYLAMRYVSGTDLRKLIAERGWLTPAAAVFLLDQAAGALDAAHRRGLVHRDVKPGNLLISQGTDDADPDHVYLADFGITSIMDGRTGLASAGLSLGAARYTSPEQVQERTVLGTADQYSLGCVLYECLAGRAPFEEDSDEAIMWAHVHESPLPPSPLRPGLPPAIDAVFARVLAKDPEGRYANCREFITAARDALATAPAQARDGWAPGPRTPDLGEPNFGEPGPRAPDFGPPGGFRRAPAATPSRGLRDLGRDPAAQPREPAASTGLPARTTGPNAGLPARTNGPNAGLPARTTGPSAWLPAGTTGPGGPPAGTPGTGDARVSSSPASGRHRLARHRAPERRGLRSVLGLLTELVRRRPAQHHLP